LKLPACIHLHCIISKTKINLFGDLSDVLLYKIVQEEIWLNAPDITIGNLDALGLKKHIRVEDRRVEHMQHAAIQFEISDIALKIGIRLACVQIKNSEVLVGDRVRHTCYLEDVHLSSF